MGLCGQQSYVCTKSAFSNQKSTIGKFFGEQRFSGSTDVHTKYKKKQSDKRSVPFGAISADFPLIIAFIWYLH